jgi:hypothetical protein
MAGTTCILVMVGKKEFKTGTTCKAVSCSLLRQIIPGMFLSAFDQNIHCMAGIIDASLKMTLTINYSFVRVVLVLLLNCRCSGSGNVMVYYAMYILTTGSDPLI